MIDFTATEAYWGADKSTRVIFESGSKAPDEQLVSACFVFPVVDRTSLLMAHPKRGWGLPGGHKEQGETLEECARREVYEETAARLGALTLIGWWRTKKQFDSVHNKQYPNEAFQLLYLADVVSLDSFTPKYEVDERAVVPFAQVEEYHKNFQGFEAIFSYATSFA